MYDTSFQVVNEKLMDDPEFDPAEFVPGQAPKTVKIGGYDYVLVASGVSNTGI